MEHLNKVHLRGIVGRVSIFNVCKDGRIARLAVVTTRAYRDETGNAIMENTWHNVLVSESDGSGFLDKLTNGVAVDLTGRLRTIKYTDESGTERNMHEVVANELHIVNPD